MQIRIPTPDVQADGSISVSFGKEGRTFPSAADAAREIDDKFDSMSVRELVRWIALKLGKDRPALRGKTITLDLSAPTNLMTVG
jgi:hypothetical protein